ncbi:MAG: histidinol-phosphatase family [Campylobacterota bacterium]|nr:histidinol-phosphatase family [Campylobacterota bacterium]
MQIDLHNHTYLCNHATGKMEEYVKQAIANKTKFFGFSDHAPMNFDPRYRMTKEQTKIYEDEIERLKELYKSQITILKGYEVDFLPNFMDEDILKKDVDYLIGSVHFLNGWGFDNPEFISKYAEVDINEIWIAYFETIQEMANSKLFDIVGHIDLIKVFKFLPTINMKKHYKKTLEAIKEADMTIELNPAGLRKKIEEQYPSKEILEMAFSMSIPITIGSDAHKPEDVGFKLDFLQKLAYQAGYREIAIFKERERMLIKI